MDINSANVEEIVRQVLSSMQSGNTAPATTAAKPAGIPKTARVAMLTALEKFELKEYPIPPLGELVSWNVPFDALPVRKLMQCLPKNKALLHALSIASYPQVKQSPSQQLATLIKD